MLRVRPVCLPKAWSAAPVSFVVRRNMRTSTIPALFACVAAFAGCHTKDLGRYAQSPDFGSCINGLRMIEGAKQQWALETHADSNAVPTWEQIRLRVKSPAPTHLKLLRCPSGGTYTIGTVTTSASCSYGGPGHKLE